MELGLRTTAEVRKEILELVSQLEAQNPTPAPTEAPDLLDGNWILLFLWRENATFAISRHYKRFNVFEEAEANKAAGKYNNDSINAQIAFYKSEGLTPYSPAKLPIISDVPEGCVIIKEHTPISNLFTCLWFNEVDRFTSRDQISFSTVRDKIMSRVNWRINMYKDCERRNFVNQNYHRDILQRRNSTFPSPRPPSLTSNQVKKSPAFSNSQVEKSEKPAKLSNRRRRKFGP